MVQQFFLIFLCFEINCQLPLHIQVFAETQRRLKKQLSDECKNISPLIVGNPLLAGKYSNLPNLASAAIEVEEIGKLLGVQPKPLGFAVDLVAVFVSKAHRGSVSDSGHEKTPPRRTGTGTLCCNRRQPDSKGIIPDHRRGDQYSLLSMATT